MVRGAGTFYAGVGPVLLQYQMDAETCSLVLTRDLVFPANIQYAWKHSHLPIMYVGCSSRLSRSTIGKDHWVCAVRTDPEHGAPGFQGELVRVPCRPVHLTCDDPTTVVIIAYNDPAGIEVIRVHEDGSLDESIPQRFDVDTGIYPHQVRVTSDNRYCICVARGNPATRGWWAAKGRQADPGVINVFAFKRGILGDQTAVRIGDGFDFGPRHLDFHPARPWMYVTLETQNAVVVYKMDGSGSMSGPLQRFPTLANPEVRFHQGLGTVHVHPHGHVVYVANRGHVEVPQRGGQGVIPAEVENSLVVYAINKRSGRLTEIQRIDSGGLNPRTFGIDPSGAMLVAANAESHLQVSGSEFRWVAKNLTTFAIARDGRLELREQYPVDSDGIINWAGVIAS